MGLFDLLLGSKHKSYKLFNGANDAWKAQQAAALRLDEPGQVSASLDAIRKCQEAIDADPSHGDPYVLLTNALLVCASSSNLEPASESQLLTAASNVFDYWSGDQPKQGLRIKNTRAADQVASLMASRTTQMQPAGEDSSQPFDPILTSSFVTIQKLATDVGHDRLQEAASVDTARSQLVNRNQRIPEESYPQVLGRIATERGNYFNKDEESTYVSLIDSCGLVIELQRERFGGPAEFLVRHEGAIVAQGNQANHHQPWVLDSMSNGPWEDTIAVTAMLSYRCFQADFVGETYVHHQLNVVPRDLFEYILIHDVAGLKTQLEQGAGIEELDATGLTPLRFAISARALECVDPLLSAGADVSAGIDEGRTALSDAARSGNLELARKLIEKGAALDSTSTGLGSGLQPLNDAIVVGDIEMAEFLLSRGARLEPEDPKASPALHTACSFSGESLSTLRWVLSKDADLEARDEEGRTALQKCLVGSNNLRELELLLRAGASTAVVDQSDRRFIERTKPDMHAILSPYY